MWLLTAQISHQPWTGVLNVVAAATVISATPDAMSGSIGPEAVFRRLYLWLARGERAHTAIREGATALPQRMLNVSATRIVKPTARMGLQ